ncbi:hypothetical protein KVR01_001295 [Diaporthe batatas]|uniref:uncharacterized protein n=1 Tax=Diaporthe batatas TaxID=748121 RepID=UPI001D053268|nr:uncharacterized protein KVR01_001295 [Diaporthe batatas]KAG8168546.1 hypothetical protein KVR01_001295 [Diaporthe batatas]
MDSRHIQEQVTPDQQRVNIAGSNSHAPRTPFPNHFQDSFQDSTTARAVLATVLEIIEVSGNDLNSTYSNTDRRAGCPMLKCFHVSKTPMEQIYHVTRCAEACKGEVQCWTCHKCHEFKKWHTMCNTLKSPVELLRKLSKGKRGSHASGGGPSANKKGKTAANDDFAVLSTKESHGVESMWLPEMEDRTSFVPQEIASQNAALELDAAVNNLPLPPQPRNYEMTRPLPTPPSTRDNSWSELSQNSVAYGDAKVVTRALGQPPPPYIVSAQTTADGYQPQDNVTDSLRLGIPPVQYIQESSFIESPGDIEADDALWAQDAQVNLAFLPSVPNPTTSSQYDSASEKSASMFSRSFPASRTHYPHMHKEDTWSGQLDCSVDIPGPPPFEHQQRQAIDDVPAEFAAQSFSEPPTSQEDTGARLPVQRQSSFDAGAQDSITVSVSEDGRHEHSASAPRRQQHPARRGARERKQQAGPGAAQQEYEECTLCRQRFGGIPKNRKQHLKRHLASRHGDARFRCAQPGCRHSYNRMDNLHGHEKKCHPGGRPGLPRRQPGSPAVAELAAGDVEMRGRPRAASASVEPAARGGYTEQHHGQEDPGAIQTTHMAVYGYPVATEEEHGWGHGEVVIEDPRRARATAGMMLDAGEWNVLMAGVSGGQHDYEDEAGMEEVGPPDVGHDGLAPKPLVLPCVSWRE